MFFVTNNTTLGLKLETTMENNFQKIQVWKSVNIYKKTIVISQNRKG